MSARAIKIISILYLIMVFVGIFLGIAVTRLKHIESTNQFFQNITVDAEQFIQTFQTMDLGLRAKAGQKIVDSAAQQQGIRFVGIQTNGRETALLWQSPETDVSLPEKNGVPTIPVALNSDFWSQINEASLNGTHRLVAWTNILLYEDLLLIGILSITALVGLGVFLLLVLLVLNVNPEKGFAEVSHIVELDEPKPRPHPVSAPIVFEPDPGVPSRAEEETQIGEIPASKQEKESKFVLLDRKSGVSHEQFLSFRLDKELERSAENVVDMSLALFRFQNIGAEEHPLAAAMVLSEFSHEDLIFEYGTDCFCVILPQTDLDQAIVRAELLIRKAENQLSKNKQYVLTAGLSSRNGRLLDSKRFLKEANTALNKANTREGRIVGFRPDPVRFRNFLRHQRV